MLISRSFATHEGAMEAVDDLKLAGFSASAITIEEQSGGTLVSLDPPFGNGLLATRILERARTGDTGVRTTVLTAEPPATTDPASDATPLSSAMGWRVLLHDNAPLSHWLNWPLLSKTQAPKATLLHNPAPLSSAIGWQALWHRPAPLSTATSTKVLLDEPAPLSKAASFTPLLHEPDPLSSRINFRTIWHSPAPLSDLLGLPVLLKRK
jgi:hypothetical protein